MITQRFNMNPGWKNYSHINRQYLGLRQFLVWLHSKSDLTHNQPLKMLEIGCSMGESTMMFASSGLFCEIHCIEPFEGYEEFNELFDYDWEMVKKEYLTNTRYWDNIRLWEDYSYNVVDEFEDEYFDLIYIDASHEYKDFKRDLEQYLPKLKKQSSIISGHDYAHRWWGVVKAVDEVVGVPHQVFLDSTWVHHFK